MRLASPAPLTMRDTASRTTRRANSAGIRLGERLRQLRVAAGLTQSELAGDRFSKEYVSQIERGKTRPTEGTIEWLADRLGVDAGFLASGVATDERARLEGAIAAERDASSEAWIMLAGGILGMVGRRVGLLDDTELAAIRAARLEWLRG